MRTPSTRKVHLKDIASAQVLVDALDAMKKLRRLVFAACIGCIQRHRPHVDQQIGFHCIEKGLMPRFCEQHGAMALMVDGHFRHLPVVNADGHVIGMISMRDLMAYTSLRLRGGHLGAGDDLDPAEVIATIFRMRTGAA